MLCWTPGLWTRPAVWKWDVLRRQPLDPQPQDVHPDGKPGRRVPSLESQSEYLTWGAVGLEECPELCITWDKTFTRWKGRENSHFLNTQLSASVWEQRGRCLRKEVHYCQNYAEGNQRMKALHASQIVFLLVCCCCFVLLSDLKQCQQLPSPALPILTGESRNTTSATEPSGSGQDPVTSLKMSPVGVGTPGVLRRHWHTIGLEKSPHRFSLFFILPINFKYICMYTYIHTHCIINTIILKSAFI